MPPNYKRYAILARTNRQLHTAARELTARGYPVQIVGDRFSLYQQEEFRVIRALWKCVVQPYNTIHAQYLMLKPRRIYSGIQQQALKLQAMQAQQPLITYLPQHIVNTSNQLNPEMWLPDAYETTVTGLDLPALYDQEPAIASALTDTYPDILHQWTQDYPESAYLEGFLDWYAISSVQDSYDPDKNAITLSTVHAAKGLEWEQVFVVGMNQNIFPHKRADIEEERRLGYVALTRAKKVLSVSGFRSENTKYQRSYEPSQFIHEMKGGSNATDDDSNRSA